MRLISDFRSYESKTIKIISIHDLWRRVKARKRNLKVYDILNSLKKYDNLNDRLQAITDSLVKYFDAYFARLWFVDKDRK